MYKRFVDKGINAPEFIFTDDFKYFIRCKLLYVTGMFILFRLNNKFSLRCSKATMR